METKGRKKEREGEENCVCVMFVEQKLECKFLIKWMHSSRAIVTMRKRNFFLSSKTQTECNVELFTIFSFSFFSFHLFFSLSPFFFTTFFFSNEVRTVFQGLFRGFLCQCWNTRELGTRIARNVYKRKKEKRMEEEREGEREREREGERRHTTKNRLSNQECEQFNQFYFFLSLSLSLSLLLLSILLLGVSIQRRFFTIGVISILPSIE